ncbi:MAG: S41 family peptidase, partial [Patescibacteria group bacterium]
MGLIKKSFALYLGVLLIAGSFLGGLYVGRDIFPKSGQGQLVNVPAVGEKPAWATRDVDFDLFRQTWNIIRSEYIDRDQVLDSELFYGALRGLVASVGDPHSIFFDPQETSEFSLELDGNFEGIGAEIGLKKNQLVIIAPLTGSPAAVAGLQANDAILAIDGQATAGLYVNEAVQLIRGTKGTIVTLLISRTDWPEPREIKIVRNEIHFNSVTWEVRADQIGYIEVTSFNQDTMALFRQAVNDMLTKNPDGIILDLRNNPGGYLDQAVGMASEWIKSGPVVIETFDGQQQEYPITGAGRLADFRTVVLVNGGSASGSEIVAGALQDAGRGWVIGEQTFGKGSVQELKMLPDGSSIKLTIARWLTPKGRSID